ncbi:hypothetical protein [Leptospira kemamanensis]|uniref:hypothetical protein n=1 Tax=Leptospira kemamanensis TaxID=2484942 RepID=UPI001FCA1214|nr:hypothetical protein [Leptospira kemamanensis]
MGTRLVDKKKKIKEFFPCVETSFLTNSILVKATMVNDYVFLFGVAVWTILALSGIWFWKRTHIGKMGFVFTLVSFLPFSFLCYQSYETEDRFVYKLKLDTTEGTIQFGDSDVPDIELPIEEFHTYQVRSESESKKDGIRYTDTIYIHHKSGLLLPVATVSVKRDKDNQEGFSRYSLLSREFKKFFRILPLPVETETGKPFQELLIKPELPKEKNPGPKLKNKALISLKESEMHSLKKVGAPPFPIEWKHQIISANWYFSFSLLAIGHLGMLLFIFNFLENRNHIMYYGILILLFGYLSFGSQYYFWILPKSKTVYKIEAVENGFRYYSIQDRGDKFDQNHGVGEIKRLEGEWFPNREKIVFLELPKKSLHFQSKLAYEKAMALADSLESDSPDLKQSFRLTKEVYDSSEWVLWDLSDLPMEVAVRFFLVLSHSLD